MSKWPMRGHFQYLRFKTFPMTPRTHQCELFWALLSNPKHSGVPEDSKSPTLGVLGFTPTLGQSGVATLNISSIFLEIMALHMVAYYMPQVAQVNEELVPKSFKNLTLMQHSRDENLEPRKMCVRLEIDSPPSLVL